MGVHVTLYEVELTLMEVRFGAIKGTKYNKETALNIKTNIRRLDIDSLLI